MSIKKPVFVNDNIYHIYNRGVEKRQIFMEDYDYLRFIHNLFEFNDTSPAGKYSELRTPTVNIAKKRDILVEILCFCLMPNHYHLIIRQLKEGGIVYFMKKIGLGYAMYFNQKYERVGSLFQGRFKAILVENDRYLLHLSRYIHINPLELHDPNWAEKKSISQDGFNFLNSYRWSSYKDYTGSKNFPSITSRDFILSIIGDKSKYNNFIHNYISSDLNKINVYSVE